MRNLYFSRAARVPRQFVAQKIDNKRYRSAEISLRRQADLRKKAIRENKYFIGAKFENGEWDPLWDRQNKDIIMKTPKTHKIERNRAERVAKIEEAMKTMDERVKQLRDERKASVPKSYFERKLKAEGIWFGDDGQKKKKK